LFFQCPELPEAPSKRGTDVLVLLPTVSAVAAHCETVNVVAMQEGVGAAPSLGGGQLLLEV